LVKFHARNRKELAMTRIRIRLIVRIGLTAALLLLPMAAIQALVAGSSGAATHCQPSRIRIARAAENGAGGTEGVPFVLSYNGSGTCTLQGFPTIKFYDAKGDSIKLRTSTTKLNYFAAQNPKKVTLSHSQRATFGIEFTQNLNQKDQSTNCTTPTATVSAPISSSKRNVALRVTWPTGKHLWNYAIDWCFAGWRYRVTAIEPGTSPSLA
jgi:Protein of unknown function (DUF4232)